ncbi:MAG: DUF2089 family protein [Planctomycetota bacterium]
MDRREIDCPYCKTPMQPVKAACPRCGVAVEGRFKLPRVALLPPDEAAFLAEYALAGFSIKDLETRVGMSYPAVRARLNHIIESMKKLSAPAEARQAILDRLERGELRADEAIQMIETL